MESEMMLEDKASYKAVLEEDWENLPLKLDSTKLFFPINSLTRDTAIHLAVHSGEEEPTRSLLAMISSEIDDALWKNASGNTPLNEAAAVGNLAAAKLLASYNRYDMLCWNVNLETPLYKAAKFGHLHVLHYFLDEIEDYYSRHPSNWIADKVPIIHAAIHSQNFEIVLKLADFDESLLEMEDEEGRTGLYLLANMPTVYKSGTSMHWLESIIYNLLPEKVNDKYSELIDSSLRQQKNGDLEAGHKTNCRPIFHTAKLWLYLLYCSFWKLVIKGWPKVSELHEKKRQHGLVMRVTKMLAEKENPVQKYVPEQNRIQVGESEKHGPAPAQVEIDVIVVGAEKDIPYDDHQETALLSAAARGITEIVDMLYEANPQALDYVTKNQRNILHVAIAHRQTNVFNWINKRRLIMYRLLRRIDAFSFTALHHVGITKYLRGGAQLGPALQLQSELIWFQLVKDKIPAVYNMHHSKEKGTAREFFEETHANMLKEATEWLKKTSEACSAVSVLVATVVFAAVFSVPGGFNSKTGTPVLLKEPIYIAFAMMDIIALATSLSSVVLFLSILTSSFRMEDFLESLPSKLSRGFQCLFFSVATAMAAFALSVVLTVRSEKKWTLSILYVAAFFPVTLFVVIQLPLYKALVKTIWAQPGSLSKFIPMNFVNPIFKAPSKFFLSKLA